jgi:hypothetical protein
MVKVAAKLYIDDDSVGSRNFTQEVQEMYIGCALKMSCDIKGIVECHIVMSSGGKDLLGAYDTWKLCVFDNGREVSKEYVE